MPNVVDEPIAPAYLRTLPESECYELLAVSTVGRFGFASPTGVQIIPVDYRIGPGHRLFTVTRPHGTIAQLAQVDAPVAFEVDYHSSDFGIAWSVLMQGTVRFLDAEASAAYAELRLPPVPWPGLASTVAVQFVPQTISGRGLHRR